MEKIVGSIFTFVTLILIASISLMINTSNEQVVSATNIPAPGFPQDMLKQKSIQADPNEQMPEVAPPEMELGSSQDEMPNPNEGTTQQPPDIQQYRLNVKFDQITVHNDHEGALSGDGEYLLSAYVHGNRVDLTKLSQWKDSGLGDVSNGETVKFRPGNLMTFNLDSYIPLTIFTVGSEDDGCQKGVLPATVRNLIESKVANETRGNASKAAGAAIGGYYGGPAGAQIGAEIGPELRKYSAWLGNRIESFVACKVNADDKIGEIVEAFNAPSYGTGPHTVQSDLKDFTLTYTIDAERVR
jgi:hypothetical protein